MQYVDLEGNEHVMNESHSLAILSEDKRCRWGFNKGGKALISIDDQRIMEARVEIELEEGRWVSFPYQPVPIHKILYRKTYAVKEWLGHRSKSPKYDKVITDKAIKWEVGMNLCARTNTTKVQCVSRIFVPEYGEAVFEVWSNLPVRVYIKTKTFEKMFERNGPQLLKFSAGVY